MSDQLERVLRGETPPDRETGRLASLAAAVRAAHERGSGPTEGQTQASAALHRAIAARRQAQGERRRPVHTPRLVPALAAVVVAVAAVAVLRGPSTFMSAVDAASGLFTSAAGDVKVEVRLDAGADPLASGKAKGELREDRTRFGVEVEDVSTSGLHAVVVTRGGVVVAGAENLSVTVDALGFGDLNLDSRDGDAAPVVQEGDLVEVIAPGGAVVLHGILMRK